MNYIFDLDKFKKTYDKLCPCLILTKENDIDENRCPCKEFLKTGDCRCGLFTPQKTKI